MSAADIFQRKKGAAVQEEHWIPLSDLMTGLMMMFMLIAIVFMLKVQSEAKLVEGQALVAKAQADKVKAIARVYDAMRVQLYEDLYAEFKPDLPQWGAELFPDLTLRFEEPDVLFDTGKDILKPTFARILDNFFPRYVRILSGSKYRDSIDEIRIEGHTSSVWNNQVVGQQAYFNNMALSQSRTRTVLIYLLSQPKVAEKEAWIRRRLTANGLSSSKLILRPDGTENVEASQRVEFRVRTNAEERIAQILQAAAQ